MTDREEIEHFKRLADSWCIEYNKQRMRAELAINLMVEIATKRVGQLQRDCDQGDKVICAASGIWGDVVRMVAELAPERLPLPLPSEKT